MVGTFPSQMLAGVVSDFASLTHPPNSSPLAAHHGKHGGSHALRKERVLLGEVDDVEAKSLSARDVSHAEEEPLVIAAGVYVILQDQIELPRLSLVGSEEIAALKVRTELHAASAAGLFALCGPIRVRCNLGLAHLRQAQHICGEIIAFLAVSKLLVDQRARTVVLAKSDQLRIVF